MANLPHVVAIPLGYKRGFWPLPDNGTADNGTAGSEGSEGTGRSDEAEGGREARRYQWNFAGQTHDKPTRQSMVCCCACACVQMSPQNVFRLLPRAHTDMCVCARGSRIHSVGSSAHMYSDCCRARTHTHIHTRTHTHTRVQIASARQLAGEGFVWLTSYWNDTKGLSTGVCMIVSEYV